MIVDYSKLSDEELDALEVEETLSTDGVWGCMYWERDDRGVAHPCPNGIDDVVRAYLLERTAVAVDAVDLVWRVSTVFLVNDHNFDIGEPPLLYETLVNFDGRNDPAERYTTGVAAWRGHQYIIAEVRAGRWVW